MRRKKSAVVGVGRAICAVRSAAARLEEDRVQVYAAQASFFSVTSAIPLLMLIISLARFLFPDFVDGAFAAAGRDLPEKFSGLFSSVYNEIAGRASAPTVSLSAISMFWLSSRGVAALTRGVSEVYGTRDKTTFVSETAHSIIYTLMMIASVLLSFTVLVFGSFIRDRAVAKFPQTAGVFNIIIRLRAIVFFVVLALVFSLIFAEVSRTGRKKGADRSEIPSGFRAQLPGAAVAALGWMLYSFFYSLYIEYFPNASYIYGSLAAVILFMFWTYFCMMILLVGAEINKFIMQVQKKRRSPAAQSGTNGA